jgi:hypothetical protein
MKTTDQCFCVYRNYARLPLFSTRLVASSLSRPAHYIQTLLSRTQSTLGRGWTRPNSSAEVRRTVFKLEQSRREEHCGRMQCTVRLCTARRMSLEEHDTARPRDKRSPKTRAIRGQRGTRFCFCVRQEALNTVLRFVLANNGSFGLFVRRRRHRSKNARDARVSREPPHLGQRLPCSAQCMHATRSRLHLPLRRVAVRPNRFAIVRRTLFKLKQRHRQATHGRLRCAGRLCVARDVSLSPDSFARQCEHANDEHARDPWSTTAVVVLLRA